MNLEDYLKLAGQSFDLQTRKGQKPIYGSDYYQSEDADEYFVNIPGIGEVNLGFDGTGGKAQLGSGDILGQDGNSQFSSVWSPWTAKDGKASFGNIDTQQEQRSGSWVEENLPMLSMAAMALAGGMGAAGALGGGAGQAAGAGGWTSGFDLAGGGALEGMGSAAGFGGSGAGMDFDLGGLTDFLGGGGDGAIDWGSIISPESLQSSYSGAGTSGWEQFAMGQVPEASVLGTGAGNLSSGPGFLDQLQRSIQGYGSQLGDKLMTPQGLGGLLGAFNQSMAQRGMASDLRGLFGPASQAAQQYGGLLSESYSNPEKWLQGPEATATRNVVGDYLQRQDAAGGRLSNDFGRQAKLNDLMMAQLGQYRQGLSGLFNSQQSIATGQGPQQAIGLDNLQFSPFINWMGNNTPALKG